MKKRMKRLFALVLACTMIFSTGLVASAAELSDLFDAHYYADANPDLKALYGYDEAALYAHFTTTGLYEGREASPLFSVKEYKTKYSALQPVLGDGYAAYYQHYLNNGIKEGRSSCGLFDAVDYANKNPDLRATFGYDLKTLYKHYMTQGIEEGRPGGLLFNGYCYAELNPDLSRAFGGSAPQMFRHYVLAGMAAGREGARANLKYEYICEKKDAHLVKDWTVAREVSCTEDGKQSGPCVICGKYINLTVEKREHTRGKIVNIITKDGKKYYVCECLECKRPVVLAEVD